MAPSDLDAKIDELTKKRAAFEKDGQEKLATEEIKLQDMHVDNYEEEKFDKTEGGEERRGGRGGFRGRGQRGGRGGRGRGDRDRDGDDRRDRNRERMEFEGSDDEDH